MWSSWLSSCRAVPDEQCEVTQRLPDVVAGSLPMANDGYSFEIG
jgi:hypothetical protein